MHSLITPSENNATFYGGALYANESILSLLGNAFLSNTVNNSSTDAAIFANNSQINRNKTVPNVFFNNTAINGGEIPLISSPNSVITLNGDSILVLLLEHIQQH